jgi:flagella basal body P-ring formation protein FlgA
VILTSLLLAAGLTVSLPAETRVAGTELTIGSVAVLQTADAAVGAAVGALSLGYSPTPGYSRLIWAHQLESVIAASFPELELNFVGETACRVWPLTRTLAANTIRTAAERELVDWIGGRDASYELRQAIGEVVIPEGKSEPVLVARPLRDELRPGVVNLAVRVQVDGDVYQTVWTSWQVTLWEVVPVLRRRVRPGERLTTDLLQERRVPRETSEGPKVLVGDLLIGAIAKRELLPSAVVTAADVERPLVVQRGDAVFVRVHKGLVQARVAGVARGAGALGDRIAVVCNDSGQELTGRVVRSDLVDVDLDTSLESAPKAPPSR